MNSYEKLARILGTSPEALEDLDQKMTKIAGKQGVMDSIAGQNDESVARVLSDLHLTKESSAEDIYNELTHRLIHLDEHLFGLLGGPDLSKLSNDPGPISRVALDIFTPLKGLFIKKEKVAELLSKQPPQSLLDHFGYQSVQELLDKEGFSSVVSALRFTQTDEWMHSFFDMAYNDLKPEDFQEREVEIKILEPKWLEIAGKFMRKKFHNVSHLKEFGVIFIIPLPIDTPGETLRMFTLILHYLHEVPFYTELFRKHIKDANFISEFQSLLRGDVPEGPAPKIPNVAWRIVQRYLAKDNPNDFRLFEHHVNPEAEHWLHVSDDYVRLAQLMKQGEGKFNIGYWQNLDCVGDFFKTKSGLASPAGGSEKLISFNIIDLVMSLVEEKEMGYIYHQEEALWNKIFSEYMGHEKMNQLIEEHIIDGFIEL